MGQSAAALHPPSADNGEKCPGNTARINAVVAVITVVLDGDQGIDDVSGHILQPNQHTVFIFPGVDAPDHHRIQANQVESGAIGPLLQRLNTAAIKNHLQRHRFLTVISKIERSCRQVHHLTTPMVASRFAGPARFAIAEQTQLCQKLRRAQLQAGIELQRPGIYPRRQCKPLALEPHPNSEIEIGNIGRRQQYAEQYCDEKQLFPGNPPLLLEPL